MKARGHSLFVLGGSSVYTALMLESLARFDLLNKFDEITLCGRDSLKLNYLIKWGQYLAGPHATVTMNATLNFEDMVHSKYNLVFNQIRFGGMKARAQDEALAAQLHCFADETLGLVGISNGFRTVKAIQKIFQKLEQAKNQQDYLFLNFTNPCSLVCQYAYDHFGIPVVGLCDYPEIVKKEIAKALGGREFDWEYLGLNHLGVVKDIWVDGKSVLKEVKQATGNFPEFSEYLIKSWDFVLAKSEKNLKCESPHKASPNRGQYLYELENRIRETMVAQLVAQLAEDSSATIHQIPQELYQRNCDWYDLIVSPYINKRISGQESSKGVSGSLGKRDFVVNRPLPNGPRPNGESSGDFAGQVWEANEFFFQTPSNSTGTSREITAESISPPLLEVIQKMKASEKLLIQSVDGTPSQGFETLLEACRLNPMIGDDQLAREFFASQ